MFMVNEQKYIATTDGTYADQDIHRIGPNFTVTAVDAQNGKFATRNSLSAPMGMGYDYLQVNPSDKVGGARPQALLERLVTTTGAVTGKGFRSTSSIRRQSSKLQ